MSHPPPVRRPATRRVTRRAALRWGGRAMLGGVAGGACAARAPSTTGIGLPGPVLAPVDVSWDRIIRRVVGLRPYRPAGFRLAAARMGDQVVVHNYGHGGGGISLSWGTAELAAREAEAAAIGQARRAAVGCSSLVRGPQRTGGLSSMSLAYHDFDTLIGTLRVVGDDGGIERIDLPNAAACDPDPGWRERRRSLPGPLGEAKRQLREYFGGERRDFDLPLSPAGTAFQRRVWDELRRIPYGETVSYGELARRIGRPTASRAVGAANGRNPLAIVVPCHRVIGTDGTLTGYGGGLPVKETLLAHERRVAGGAR